MAYANDLYRRVEREQTKIIGKIATKKERVVREIRSFRTVELDVSTLPTRKRRFA